jgi:hypothetical protein
MKDKVIILSTILLALILTTTATAVTLAALAKESPLNKQGYAKGVSDAKLVQSTFPASTTMSPDEVDCDSDIDLQASIEDYCSEYQHGFADTTNKLLKK